MEKRKFESFGERLRWLRQEKGIGQVQLSLEIGVGKSIISLWERGECEPTLSNLTALARFFDVSLDFLTGLEEY